MDINHCFEPKCQLEVDCSCNCTSPATFLCELHLAKHLRLNGSHNFSPLYLDPVEETKQVILNFLKEEKFKREVAKNSLLVSFCQIIWNLKDNLKDLIKDLEGDSTIIENCFKKVLAAKKISKSEEDAVLNLLVENPDGVCEKLKEICSLRSDSCNNAQMFYGVTKEIDKVISRFKQKKLEISQGLIKNMPILAYSRELE